MYDGELTVLWERAGKLFMKTMGHCSCNYYAEEWGRWAYCTAITPEFVVKDMDYWTRIRSENRAAVILDWVLENFSPELPA